MLRQPFSHLPSLHSSISEDMESQKVRNNPHLLLLGPDYYRSIQHAEISKSKKALITYCSLSLSDRKLNTTNFQWISKLMPHIYCTVIIENLRWPWVLASFSFPINKPQLLAIHTAAGFAVVLEVKTLSTFTVEATYERNLQ